MLRFSVRYLLPIVLSAIVFAFALGREGGSYSPLSAIGLGAVVGLVVSLWVEFKARMGRKSRQKGVDASGARGEP